MSSYKVRLSCNGSTVVFEASSPVTESRTANYDGFSITHLPTDIQVYKNTTSRSFSVQGKLVSRNAAEASQNALYINLIRSWILPDFGGSGATPPIVKFSAYNNSNITEVKTIIRSYSITFPDDIDYVWNGSDPLPVICVIGIELSEIYTPQEITAKAWKMNVVGGGSFVLGEGAGSGGGNSVVSSTPSISDLIQEGSFNGLAADGLINSPNPQEPSLARTLGVEKSNLLSSPVPNGTSSAAKNISNQAPSTPPTTTFSTPSSDQFGRSTGLNNTSLTEV